MFVDDSPYPSDEATVSHRALESFGYLDVAVERLSTLGVSLEEVKQAVEDAYRRSSVLEV